MRKLIVLAVVLFTVSVFSASGADMLNLKTGWWQITMNSNLAAQASPSTLAQLPPQQRAMVIAMAKSKSAKPSVYHSCVTADQLKHTDHVSFSNEDNEWSCTDNSVTSLDKNTVAAKGDCTNSKDGTHMKGSGKIQVLDREHFKGSGKLTVTNPALGDVPFTNNITLTGKWVRAACPASH